MKIDIRVIPNAKIAKVDKNNDGSLKVWVKGKPFRGEASLEVIDALSNYYKIPKSSIRVIKGLTSRNKVVEV
jgi:uncharacterized protein YggU (UPF0235/DUF167 family)